MDPSRRVAELVTRSPRSLLGVAAAFTLAAAVFAAQIRLDVDLLSVFDPQGPDRELADTFAEAFGSDRGSLVAVVQTVDGGPLTESAVAAVAELSARAAAIDGLDRVASVTTTGVVRPGGVGDPEQFYAPAFAPDLVELPIDERVALARQGRLGSRQLISEDGSVLLVVGVLDAELTTDAQRLPAAETFRRELEAGVAAYTEVVSLDFAGLQYTTIETVERTRADMTLLAPLLIVAMLAITLVYFRRAWTLVAMIAAVVPSVLLTLAFMWMLGDNLNQFTTAFPVLLIGMTVATGTHLIHRFFALQADGADLAQSTWGTVRSVSGVSMLCAATNALGFLSLLIASMPVLRQFGLYLAIGVGFSFLSTALIMPAVLHVARVQPPDSYRRSSQVEQPRSIRRDLDGKILPVSRKAKIRRHPNPALRTAALTSGTTTRKPSPAAPAGLFDRLTRTYAATMARPSVALSASIAGFLLLISGGLLARGAVFDYQVNRGFPSDSTITETNALVDQQLGGSIPVEISLRGQPDAWLEPENLQRIQTFDRFLIDTEGLYTLGLPSVLAELDRLGLDQPTTPEETAGLIDGLVSDNPEAQAVVDQILTEDRGWTRMTGLRPEDGANAYLAMIDRVETEADAVFAGSSIEVDVTGNAAVSFRGVDQLTGELVWALSLAVALIVGAIALSFRSWRVAAVTILPNALPLAVGFAGYLLIFDQADPLMAGVFVIVLGIAADDTVHLANRYLSLIGRHVPPREAVVQAFVDLRPAMITSTVVLVSAFAVLLTAAMPSTRVIGWLGGGVLVLALVSDLVFGLAGIALLAAWHERRGVPRRHRRLAISPISDELPPPRPADPRPVLARPSVLAGLSVAAITLFATGVVLVLTSGLDPVRLAAFGLFAAAGLGLASALAAQPEPSGRG
jgi:predicted RND superfamily exporter protein